ncbi:M16 family metallopeptidase [Treponema pectinovorum]|uniref:M16 family metallopeptidase n=1 Tax=Treponema pectinovorum TaxID=164 RepID=UPI003D915B7F
MKKNKIFNLIFAFALFLFFAFDFSSCASSQNIEKSSRNRRQANNRVEVKDFVTLNLSNGIPVIFKKTPPSQIFTLRFIFEGGTPLVPKEKSGLEDLTLDLMFHGGKNYSYDDIQKMQYDMSFSLTSSAGRDYSVAGIQCLKKDLDSVISIFVDGILTPSFAQSDFQNLIVNSRQRLASTIADPSGQLGLELEKAAFARTSYSSSVSLTKESIDKINLEDIKAHHKKLLDCQRIKIVVVSDFNETEQKNFIQKLSLYFSSIKKGEYKEPLIQKIAVSGDDLYFKNENAGTSGYALAYFACPNRYEKDYIPFALCLMYLDDILFAEVREKAGAVYSVGSGVLTSKSMLAVISAYKVSDNKNIKSLINEAIKKFPDENHIEEKLEQYKNKYLTTLFSSSKNSRGLASNVITSLEYSGKADSYLNRPEQVKSVTAKDIELAYKKYIFQGESKSNKMRWIFVTK